MPSQVSLVKCGTYSAQELLPKVKEAFVLLGGLSRFIKPSSKVLVKPNLLMAVTPDANITTHPEFVRAIIRLLKEIGCQVYIGDGPGVFGGNIEDVNKVYGMTGMRKIAQDEGASLVTFEKSYFVDAIAGKSFPLTVWVKECDYIINVPKFKTHEFMILTAAVKNLFGLIPGTFKMELHKNFYQPEAFADMLLDIYSASKPVLSIMDGISGIEGNGPATSGKKRDMGLIAASADAVALDCVLSALIGIDPQKIFTNRQAGLRNIGNTELQNIEIKGQPLSSCIINDFKLPQTSLMQIVKKNLPGPCLAFLRKMLYLRPKIDTDICRLCESCLKSCPQKVIYKKKNKLVIDYSNCISCFCCREVCPIAAVGIKKSLLAKVLGM